MGAVGRPGAGGGRGWVCEGAGGGGHRRIRLPKIYWSSLGFV